MFYIHPLLLQHAVGKDLGLNDVAGDILNLNFPQFA